MDEIRARDERCNGKSFAYIDISTTRLKSSNTIEFKCTKQLNEGTDFVSVMI